MRSKLFLTVCGLAWLSVSMMASERREFVGFKTERVIVFKDGHALIIKKGVATTDDRGEIQTIELPDAAVLGSFWATASEGELMGMRAGWVDEVLTNQVTELAQNHMQVLEANRGRECEVLMSDNRQVKGTIREIMGTEKTVQVDDDFLQRMMSYASRDGSTAVGSRKQREGAFVVLAGEDGDHFLSVANIKSLTIPKMELQVRNEIRVKRREKRLTFRFGKTGVRREIMMMYFRPGIRWIPTYRINLPKAGERIAKVIMQAELLNEAEDLLDTPVDIVVGVPNFRFKSTPSPLVLESVMRDTLRQAAPQLMGQMASNFANSQYAQRSSEFRRPHGVAPARPVNLPGELTAAQAQDLFVYSLPNVELKKGDRIAMKIVEVEAPFRNVHTWDLHVTRHDIATSPSALGASPLKLSENRIWRQIELTNTTSVPWTTGAAMIMQGQQPLAQELLAYTSIGSRCRVPVTVSIDTLGTVKEQELERKLSALTWDRYKYAQIKNEAVIDVSNHKRTGIDLELTVRIGGRVSAATLDGEVALQPFNQADWVNYRGSHAVNNSSTVIWKQRIEAGDCFSPKLVHEFYTRH